MMRRSLVFLLLPVLFAGLLATSILSDEPKAPKPPTKPVQPESKPAQPEPKPAKDPKVGKTEDYYELQKLLVDTLDQVERNYVKDVSRRELVEAAIKGVLEKLDPYSSYISPDELGLFRVSVESEFGGIGIQISMDGGQLRVLSPLVGTPAYRAGLMTGDRILEIDGKPTAGLNIEQAVKRLKGEVGTSVVLTVLHPGKAKQEQVNVVRENIHVETVLGERRGTDDKWDYMLDREKKIAYVRIAAFSRDTARELREVMERLQKDKLRGLILDLRFNPGGLLSSAIEVSDLFVADGRIVSTKGRNSPERTWNAHKEGTFLGFPAVVLVNRFTASASEIVAACLQDHKRALIVGERTWGKGSVQNVIELEEGRSALKLTTASYRRPSGKNIHKFPDSKEGDEWGVTPDKGYQMKLTEHELQMLVEDRRTRDVVQPKQVAQAEPAKHQENKPEQAKPEPGKPDPNKTKAAENKAQPPQPPAKPEKPPAALEQAKFIDPQLRIAVDYLTGELARAK